jgi:orotate phosphoribosyltransferase
MILNQDQVLNLLRSCGAFLEGHFLLSSGRHSNVYVEKFRLLEHPELTSKIARGLAEHFSSANTELVVGPLTGGVLVAHEVAKLLGKQIAFPERIEDVMQWRRGFEIRKGMRVLVCEDVITTGRSAGEVVEAVEREGGIICGIGCLIQRGRTDLKPAPFAVVKLDLQSYLPIDCPLCREGLPLTKRGSRA